ncbi:hypothetical protein M409DRAFT_30768 [Zasmidium cellare ATCC 36951]|uniref:Peptidase S9 prolyl oligopeptidase catalytic domain-containing protein n=1 Tax=Zasmidium cellare ATCC 36951 TaxID=1080233 RepID=A0A6A6BXG7_ZASCE|nr:uncharacterized protein M409DRAFT_30768 [Zasmidium cellare ATCC 36951]KAF2158738.1 hypothetical protein M409DRAFT_30768 [Zasmidium cellare ATCC 36951]
MFATIRGEWVRHENESTLQYVGRDLHDHVAVPASPRPVYTLHEHWIFEQLKDSVHPRGRLRRTNVKSIGAAHSWDTFIDLDKLDLPCEDKRSLGSIWTLPSVCTRAIVQLYTGADDLHELWEVDVVKYNHFYPRGFCLPAGRSEVAWLDADTILVMSTVGGSRHQTASGLPRTVRRWKRGSPIDNAQIIFQVHETHLAARAWCDLSVPNEELVFFTDVARACTSQSYVGTRTGCGERLPIPNKATWIHWNTYIACFLSEDWVVNGSTFKAGTVVGFCLRQTPLHIASLVVLCPGHGLRTSLFGKSGLRLLFTRNFQNFVRTFYPNDEGDWTEAEGQMLFDCPAMSISEVLDLGGGCDDAQLLLAIQGPLLPKTLYLAGRSGITWVEGSSCDFDTSRFGAVVHTTFALNGLPIRYLEVGPDRAPTGEAPVCIIACGLATAGPEYNAALAEHWLRPGAYLVFVNNGCCEEGEYRERSAPVGDLHAVAVDLVKRGLTLSAHTVVMGARRNGATVATMCRTSQVFFGAFCSYEPDWYDARWPSGALDPRTASDEEGTSPLLILCGDGRGPNGIDRHELHARIVDKLRMCGYDAKYFGCHKDGSMSSSKQWQIIVGFMRKAVEWAPENNVPHNVVASTSETSIASETV